MTLKNKPKIGDVVYIEFEDHCMDSTGWTSPERLDHKICFAKAVGFLVRNTDNYITISGLSQAGDQAMSGTMTIVKACISKIKILQLRGK